MTTGSGDGGTGSQEDGVADPSLTPPNPPRTPSHLPALQEQEEKNSEWGRLVAVLQLLKETPAHGRQGNTEGAGLQHRCVLKRGPLVRDLSVDPEWLSGYIEDINRYFGSL